MMEALDEVEPLVAALGQRCLYGLGDLELAPALSRVHGLISVLTAVTASLAAEATSRGIPTQLGYRSTQTWIRDALHLSGGHARQIVTLASVALEHPTVGEAVARGTVTPDQATVIGAALSGLAPRVTADVVAAAADRLLDCARSLGPEHLQIAADRVLTHVAPEIAEEADADALRRAEARAQVERGLTVTADRAGHRYRLAGYLTPEMAATFAAAIDPLAVKRPTWNGADVDERTAPQRRADALIELCHQAARSGTYTRSPTSRNATGRDASAQPGGTGVGTADHPGRGAEGRDSRNHSEGAAVRDGGPRHVTEAGRGAPHPKSDLDLVAVAAPDRCGDASSVVGVGVADRPLLTVTVNYDILARELSSGVLDSGFALTPEAVRRLACDAKILPATMNGSGQVLDLGRTQRTWAGPARRAVVLRDRGCIFPDCDRPPSACDIHHIVYFSHGGQTDLANAAMLCAFHHYLIHHSDWTIGHDAHGLPVVIPPAWIDPHRVSRRNTYWLRQ
jgi:hypothetical protein